MLIYTWITWLWYYWREDKLALLQRNEMWTQFWHTYIFTLCQEVFYLENQSSIYKIIQKKVI